MDVTKEQIDPLFACPWVTNKSHREREKCFRQKVQEHLHLQVRFSFEVVAQFVFVCDLLACRMSKNNRSIVLISIRPYCRQKARIFCERNRFLRHRQDSLIP